jgi:hypothetical protein
MPDSVAVPDVDPMLQTEDLSSTVVVFLLFVVVPPVRVIAVDNAPLSPGRLAYQRLWLLTYTSVHISKDFTASLLPLSATLNLMRFDAADDADSRSRYNVSTELLTMYLIAGDVVSGATKPVMMGSTLAPLAM